MNNRTMDVSSNIEGIGGGINFGIYGKTKEQVAEKLLKTVQANFDNEKLLAKTVEERGSEPNWTPPVD